MYLIFVFYINILYIYIYIYIYVFYVFYKCKQPIDINKVDINKIVTSDKDLYDKSGSLKYFIG